MKAKIVDKVQSIRFIVVASFVLLFGVIFLIIAISGMQQKIPENFVETEAKITKIEEIALPSDDIEYEHHVYIEYIYMGKRYSDYEYNRYSSSMKEGDTVILYVNPDKPSEIMFDQSGNWTFVAVGIIIVLIGAAGIAYWTYQRKRRNV